jgi:hypothetical protein
VRARVIMCLLEGHITKTQGICRGKKGHQKVNMTLIRIYTHTYP